MSTWGHQSRFKRKPRTSALSPDSRHIAAPIPKAAGQSRAGPRAPSMPRPRSTSFVSGADGQGGTLITEAAQTANHLVSLATPHTR